MRIKSIQVFKLYLTSLVYLIGNLKYTVACFNGGFKYVKKVYFNTCIEKY